MLPKRQLELVHFQITKNCNLRCWFCGQWGRKGFFSDSMGKSMDFDDWQRVTNSLLKYKEESGKLPSVILWGGEPLVSPDFGRIAEMLASNGFELGIVTNGTLIDRWADILNSCFKKIYLSVDGPEDIHDAVRGHGVFKKVVQNAQLLNDPDKRLVIMSVISDGLLSRFDEFARSMEKIKPSELLLHDMICLTDEETKRYAKWLENEFGKKAEEIFSWRLEKTVQSAKTKKRIEEALKGSYPFSVKHMAHGKNALLKTCLSPYRHAHIAWNGDVLYCTDFYDFSAGNVKEEDLISIFNNSASEKFRNEVSCGNCVTCEHCSWRNNSEFGI